jgi:hypothetical protein
MNVLDRIKRRKPSETLSEPPSGLWATEQEALEQWRSETIEDWGFGLWETTD